MSDLPHFCACAWVSPGTMNLARVCAVHKVLPRSICKDYEMLKGPCDLPVLDIYFHVKNSLASNVPPPPVSIRFYV
jgi:hypothetical protein